ncbi:tetratricopeptide repeat protein 21B isoform X3 [Harpegnathos saltator]|uniref:Tetratricopeptide repeat protein 21B n=2 Tax=Harpegnathos saltator TaxID=610380 RepID=E2B479_HARSA|nr:tetratricopeptide repeat protein 21B isoform X3 [Harpegnathos saltator]XP_019697352.1 tetratricopeptide repeat protein 21B isoform X3 [Harpegnathos saltator]EFN89496.1 Tetratricopeptide repeat protein 21B [Harpegnathos saltator]
MEETEYIALIEWHCCQHYYNGMLAQAKQARDAYPSSERLKLLLCLAYALVGKTHEAIKESSSLLNYADFILATLHVQNTAYAADGSTERSTVAQVENRIREERRKASCNSLCLAASVLFLSRRVDKAKEYIDRAYKLKPTNMNVLLIKGWVEASLSYSTDNREAERFFDSVLKEEFKNLSASLGLAKMKQRTNDHSEAISIVNSLIVRYPKSALPLVEKMKCLLTMKDWEQVLEMTNRILSVESNNLDAMKASTVVALCRDGNTSEGARQLQLFLRHLLLAEPKNVFLLIENLQLFSGIALQDHGILSELTRAAEKTLQVLTSNNVELMAALGDLYAALGNAKDAEHWYRSTIRADESSFAALMGLAHCQLLEGSADALDLARQQVDFLIEIQSHAVNVRLLLMSAKIASGVDGSKALGYLDAAANILLKNCEGRPYGYEYLRELKPNLCLEITKQRLMYSLNKSLMNDEVAVVTEKEPSVRLLELLVEACPGSSVALLLLSKAKMQSADYEGALSLLRRLLDTVEPSNAQAHLTMAQILAYQGKYQLASQSLEVGLSYNFKIREEPVYHLITGMVQREAGDLDSCVKSCQMAISLAGLSGNRKSDMSTSDRATLYLELIAAYGKAKRFAEALALVDEARTNLAGTSEQGRITIGTAEVYLDMGELENAVSCLQNINPGQPYYLQAHTRLAEINLNYKKDRQAFAKCFRELVEHRPGPKTYSMLGNAYMSIQEPERAIEAYEQALSQNPIDKADIANKMGKALIKAHQYAKAINYYKDIVKQDNCGALKLDLANLYMKMKQYDKAEATLVQELQDKRGEMDILSLEMRGQELLLLAKVREKSGNVRGALATLKEAKENQHRYIQRLAVSPDIVDQRHVLANICLTMADYATTLRNYDEAIIYYKEALSHKSTDVNALLSLAKLYMQMNNLDRCAQNCSILLNAEPNNEAASVMMADLAFRKVDFDTAAFHFRQLLIRQPTYWTALARLIEVSRRTGTMDDLDEWLQRAQTAMGAGNVEAGFYYCAGLLNWRTGKLNSALRNFNFARRDPEWGQQAIYNMIEICLDPDDDTTLSNEAFNDEDAEYQDSRTMALRTAYRLLQELNPKGSPHEVLTHKLLSNFFLLATKQKSNIEKALQDCTALASQDALRDHVGPALGMATAHILLKQTPRARNHLKRVSKNVWTFEDAEYLERCWLLLADIYVQSSKYDLANELLKRVLQHNATCVRAYELSGYIAEKDQNYREAATRYAQAWKCGGKTKLSVGYKLAYCYLKAKTYADAIEACNVVLKQSTDYPRIRKDILEKCINNLRT